MRETRSIFKYYERLKLPLPGSLTGLHWKFWGGVLAPNGDIVLVPYNSDSIGVFKPSTGAFSLIDISTFIAHDYKYVGGVLGHNGRIYLVPRNADSIGQIHLGNQEPAYQVAGGVDVTLGALLSPYFNKL